VTPALEGGPWPAAEALRQAREAALADPEGETLAQALAPWRMPEAAAAARVPSRSAAAP
jgi:hypothetical protein